MQRIFIVGCPRSGTTLLQSLICSHSNVWSIPETQFFLSIAGDVKWRAHKRRTKTINEKLKRFKKIIDVKLGRSTGHGLIRIEKLVQHGIHLRFNPKELKSHGLKRNINEFLKIMDEAAKNAGKDLWLEKSPNHVFYIDMITRTVPKVKFIHIVRDGRAVVASLYDMMQKYPDWSKRYEGIMSCVAVWNSSIKETIKKQQNQGHMIVRYDELIADPVNEMSRLVEHLGLEYEQNLFKNRTNSALDLLYNHEKWKKEVMGDLVDRKLDKYDKIFKNETKKLIEKRLMNNGDLNQIFPKSSSVDQNLV